MLEQKITEQIEQDDFRLSAAQLAFMTNAWNAIERADREDDEAFFVELVGSAEYKALFGEISIDQAIDRYEIMLGQCEDC